MLVELRSYMRHEVKMPRLILQMFYCFNLISYIFHNLYNSLLLFYYILIYTKNNITGKMIRSINIKM